MVVSLEYSKVMILLFEGETTSEIAQRFGVSQQTVRNRRRDFIEKAKENGWDMAIEELGIEQRVNALTKLARKVKNKSSIDDCLVGADINDLLNQLDIDDKHLRPFLEELYKYAENHGIKGSGVGELFNRYQKQANNSGLDYITLVDELEDKTKQHQKVETQIQNARSTLEGLKDEITSKLERNNVTDQKLEEYIHTKQSLKEYGLDIDEPSKSLKVLAEIKKLDHDPEKIIEIIVDSESLIKREQELVESNKELEEEQREKTTSVERKISELKSLETRSKALEEKTKSLIEPITALEELNGLGLGNPGVIELRDLIVKTDKTITGLKLNLEELGGFSRLLEKKREEKKELESQLKNMEETRGGYRRDIEYMENRKLVLIDERIWVLKGVEEKLEGIRDDVSTVISDPVTGFVPTMHRELKEGFSETSTFLQEYQKQYQMKLDKMKQELESMYSEIDDTKEIIFQLGLRTGQFKNAKYLTSLVLGQELAPIERRIGLASILDLAASELRVLNHSEESREALKIRDKLLR